MSSERQIKGDSLRRQLEASEAYAATHGLELDTTLRDMGVSAFDGSNLNGALGKFLDLVKDGGIAKGSYLLVESLDRLSRANVLKALSTFTQIIEAGIVLVTLADGYEYSQESIEKNWTQLVISLAIMSRAHEESAMKAHRLRERWVAKRKNITEKKLTARAPYWLKINKDRTGFEVIPERVAIVKRIFDEFIGGIGKGKIASRLNEDRIPSFGKAKNQGKQDGWHGGTIVKVIHNRSVTGWFQPNHIQAVEENGVLKKKRVPYGDPIQDYYPRIIDEDVFLKAQAAAEIRLHKARGQGWVPNAKGPKGKYYSNLFSGFSQCGKCGRGMVFKPAGQRMESMLRCSGMRRSMCDNDYKFRYLGLERGVLQWASMFIPPEDTDPAIKQIEREVAAKQLAKRDLQTKIDNLLEIQAQSRSAAARIVQLEGEIDAIDREIDELQARLSVRRGTSTLSEHQEGIRSFHERIATIPESERFVIRARLAQSLREIINRLVFYPDGYLAIIMPQFPGHIPMLLDGEMMGTLLGNDSGPYTWLSQFAKDIHRTPEFFRDQITCVGSIFTAEQEARWREDRVTAASETAGTPVISPAKKAPVTE